MFGTCSIIPHCVRRGAFLEVFGSGFGGEREPKKAIVHGTMRPFGAGGGVLVVAGTPDPTHSRRQCTKVLPPTLAASPSIPRELRGAQEQHCSTGVAPSQTITANLITLVAYRYLLHNGVFPRVPPPTGLLSTTTKETDWGGPQKKSTQQILTAF